MNDQRSLSEQIKSAIELCNKAGLYDVADYLAKQSANALPLGVYSALKKIFVPEVRVGQLWLDMDKRMNGRTLYVLRIEAGKAVCRIGATTRETKISIKRMKPGNTGYRLLREDGVKVSE